MHRQQAADGNGGGGVCAGRCWVCVAGTIGDLTDPGIQNMQIIRKKFRKSENVRKSSQSGSKWITELQIAYEIKQK